MDEDIYIDPRAIVETDEIGRGTRIWAFCHIMQGVSIGEACNIGEHCYLESGVVIGDRVTIKNGNMLWEGITLEDGVFVGPQVVFTNDRYPRSPRLEAAAFRYRDKRWLSPIRVRIGASIGGGAVILGGITLGRYCLVAAGAVVTRDVPDHALVAGSPARAVGWVCVCGQPLHFQGTGASCTQCGRSYQRCGEQIVSC